MIEINYEHSTAINPDKYLEDHTTDGMGMYGDAKGPKTADFLGLVRYKGREYLLGRTKEAFNNDPNYEGKITVRHAMVNKNKIGADKDLFIDMEEDEYTKEVEEKLVALDETEEVTSLSVVQKADELDFEVLPYGSLIQDGAITAIGIMHEQYAYIEMCRKEEKEEQLGRTY